MTAIDKRTAGPVFTHITFDGHGERLFDYQLALELGDALVISHPVDGEKHFEVVDIKHVVVDSPRDYGDTKMFSTFVQFVRCSGISLDAATTVRGPE